MPNFESPDPPGAPEGPAAVVIAVSGPIGDADVDALCDRLREALAGRVRAMVVGEAGAVGRCDVGTVDLVARLALTARRSGSRLILRGASTELRELLELAGLDDVVPCAEDSALEPER